MMCSFGYFSAEELWHCGTESESLGGEASDSSTLLSSSEYTRSRELVTPPGPNSQRLDDISLLETLTPPSPIRISVTPNSNSPVKVTDFTPPNNPGNFLTLETFSGNIYDFEYSFDNFQAMCDNQNQMPTGMQNSQMPVAPLSNNSNPSNHNSNGVVDNSGKMINCEGENNMASSASSQLGGQQLLTSILNAPPHQQQQHLHQNSSLGLQTNLSHYQGHNLGMGVDQQQQQSVHSSMQQHAFQNTVQHPLSMDNQLSSSFSQQHGQPQLRPQFNPVSQLQHHRYNMPFGMMNNNMGNGLNPYGNPQMNAFHPQHHIPNQQQGHLSPCFMPHGPFVPGFHPQDQRTTNGAAGWMNINGPGHLPIPGANVPGCIGGRNMSNGTGAPHPCMSPIPFPRVKIPSTPRVHNPSNSDPNAIPGGLEILLRELHVDCQKLMVPRDIPDSAKCRGYFTVSELLCLKRTLEARYAAGHKPPTNSTNVVDIIKEEGAGTGKRGSKRRQGGEDAAKNTKKSKAKGNTGKKEECCDQQDNSSKTESVPPAVAEVEVGGAVKAAMDALAPTSAENSGEMTMTVQGPDEMSKGKPHSAESDTIEPYPGRDMAGNNGQYCVNLESICTRPGGEMPTMENAEGEEHMSPMHGPHHSPYRTLQLVIKLLQIGPYQIRSFSLNNPNRFRIFFNNQRITYECFLPVSQTEPPSEDSENQSEIARKVLTVEISFDQLSMLQFKSDSLYMRVEGPPGLSLSQTVVADDRNEVMPNSQDRVLLDHIDKGQLKLDPIHQLHFLNERLVGVLESQMRDHPKLRHLFH